VKKNSANGFRLRAFIIIVIVYYANKAAQNHKSTVKQDTAEDNT